MSKYLLIIKGDTNDADYVHSITELTEKKWEELKPFLETIAKAIKTTSKYSQNWSKLDGFNSIKTLYDGILTDDDIDYFSDWCPSGIHSIESIKVYKFESVEEVF